MCKEAQWFYGRRVRELSVLQTHASAMEHRFSVKVKYVAAVLCFTTAVSANWWKLLIQWCRWFYPCLGSLRSSFWIVSADVDAFVQADTYIQWRLQVDLPFGCHFIIIIIITSFRVLQSHNKVSAAGTSCSLYPANLHSQSEPNIATILAKAKISHHHHSK